MRHICFIIIILSPVLCQGQAVKDFKQEKSKADVTLSEGTLSNSPLTNNAVIEADLSITGTRLAQQVVCEISGLTSGKHAISIINRGPGPVAVDAILINNNINIKNIHNN